MWKKQDVRECTSISIPPHTPPPKKNMDSYEKEKDAPKCEHQKLKFYEVARWRREGVNFFNVFNVEEGQDQMFIVL